MNVARAAVFAVLLATLTPSISQGAPVACSPGSLSDYFSLSEGCTVGGLLFQNFAQLTTQPAGSTLIAPATIQVTPVASGLAFGVDVTADTGQLLEILFGYDVVNPAITAASLSLDGAFAAADGAVTAAKTFCEGGTFDPGSVTGCTGTQDGLIAFALDGLTDLNESLAILPAISFLSVVDDIAVDGGLNGNASLTGSVTNQFASATPVPEPTTSVLVATGILGLLRARARRVRRRPS